MVRREIYSNKIRSLGYKYKNHQKRTYLYRKVGGTHYISVPMADLLEDEFVYSSLRQAGVFDAEIKGVYRISKELRSGHGPLGLFRFCGVPPMEPEAMRSSVFIGRQQRPRTTTQSPC